MAVVGGEFFEVGFEVAEVEFSWFDGYFPEDVVFLVDFYDSGALAEYVFDDFGAGFDVLAVFDLEEGTVFVDFVAFFGYPQEGAAFDDFVSLFGFAPSDFDSCVFDAASGCGSVAVVD